MNLGNSSCERMNEIPKRKGVVEVLERKGVLTRQEIYDAIIELRQRHPEATTLERPPVKDIRRPT